MRIWADLEAGMLYRAVPGKEMLERRLVFDDTDDWSPSKILKLRHAEGLAEMGTWKEFE